MKVYYQKGYDPVIEIDYLPAIQPNQNGEGYYIYHRVPGAWLKLDVVDMTFKNGACYMSCPENY